MVDIVALLLVAAASIGGAAIFVSLCALGLRLLVANGTPRPRKATWGAYTCFALCAIAVGVAVYLIVPVWQ